MTYTPIASSGGRRVGGIQKQLFASRSLIDGYRSTVVGGKGFGLLLYYEFMNVLLTSVPGIIGETLRRLCFPPLFGSIGRGVRFGKNMIFRKPHLIFIGADVLLNDFVCLDVKADGKGIHIEENVVIGEGTILSCAGGSMRIGRGSRIGRNCRIGSLLGLTIGNGFSLGEEGCIVGASHLHGDIDIPIIEQPLTARARTVIGDNVWIGRRVTILDGLTIGSGARIDDDTMVNKPIASNGRGRGVPVMQTMPKAAV